MEKYDRYSCVNCKFLKKDEEYPNEEHYKCVKCGYWFDTLEQADNNDNHNCLLPNYEGDEELPMYFEEKEQSDGNKKYANRFLLDRFVKFDYQPEIKVARDKYCKELIEILSNENFINPTFERRKAKLKQELELLYTIVWSKFFEKYRED